MSLGSSTLPESDGTTVIRGHTNFNKVLKHASSRVRVPHNDEVVGSIDLSNSPVDSGFSIVAVFVDFNVSTIVIKVMSPPDFGLIELFIEFSIQSDVVSERKDANCQKGEDNKGFYALLI
jgi:hypothetical protein